MKVTRITFDLETGPTEDPEIIKFVSQQAIAKTPASNTKKDTKDLWDTKPAQAARASEAIAKTSLNPMFGRILCIGYIADYPDADSEVVEIDLMLNAPTAALIDLANKWDAIMDADTVIVGHYIAGFDLGFLVNAWRKVGATIPPNFPVFRNGYWRGRVYDTMQHIPNNKAGYVSLDEACLAYGLGSAKKVIWEGKPMDGSRVAAAEAAEAYDLLLRYCMTDVQMERALYLAQTSNGTYGTPEATLTPLAELRETIAEIKADDTLNKTRKCMNIGQVVLDSHLAT